MSPFVFLFAVVFILALLYVTLIEPFWMKASFVELSIGRLTTPLKILHISDSQLKRRKYGRREAWILKRLPRWQCDLICVTGDIFQARPGVDAALDFLRQLSAFAPTFVVLGNWEYWSKADLEEYGKRVSEIGVYFLLNRSMEIEVNGQKILVAGVDDTSQLRHDFSAAVPEMRSELPVVLLAHAPEVFPAARRHNVDLMLSGHSHGGQVRFPFFGVAYLPPGCGPFDYGLYENHGSFLYVTSGVGTSIFQIRFNCRPEVAIITLRPA